jgi:hypothetical protein
MCECRFEAARGCGLLLIAYGTGRLDIFGDCGGER